MDILKLKDMLLNTKNMNICESRPIFSNYIAIFKESRHHDTIEAREYDNGHGIEIWKGNKLLEKNLTPEMAYEYFINALYFVNKSNAILKQ